MQLPGRHKQPSQQQTAEEHDGLGAQEEPAAVPEGPEQNRIDQALRSLQGLPRHCLTLRIEEQQEVQGVLKPKG